MRRICKKDKGQALVEMALALPILILLLLGIMEFGRIFEGYLEIQNAARDGARYAAIHRSDWKDLSDYTPWVNNSLKPWVQSRLVMLDTGTLTVSFKPKSSVDQKDLWVEVNLTSPLKILTPVISSLVGKDGILVLEAHMAMRSE